MDAIIMAGGKGSRMGNVKKMLLNINGMPVLYGIIASLKDAGFKINICITKNTEFLSDIKGTNIIVGTGNYADDLRYSLGLCSVPALILPADVIFSKNLLNIFIGLSDNVRTDIATLKVNGELSGISIFFKRPEDTELSYTNIEIEDNSFFNLNYPNDYIRARQYFKQ
ncbi:MAG: NTP transferase domain-containing protein [Ferroplasma sp.]|uniref:NTP transferase domain-containing protein n=1 Tax=Ferroplasma sp. TaxID=2591003 RepID=UPI002816421B|nr:NTP transferase domain-containing protein [Ferroplasma sp.]WMT50996.1 MAG: NTP transferase domain-containing protein [Ferroplasma sp.]